tara:strand:- start:344 stop:580 length:237 start_codon:yes stop_codon:yes gene_type:complete
MPYIKKSEFIYLQNKIKVRQDILVYNKMFDDYIREHNYELWGFAHSDIKRKIRMASVLGGVDFSNSLDLLDKLKLTIK